MSTVEELIESAVAAESEVIQKALLEGGLTSEQLTFGPDVNNLSGSYTQPKAAWDFKYVDKLSPDILLIFLSKMAQAYRKTRHPNITAPLTRAAKDTILLDRYPVHQIPE